MDYFNIYREMISLRGLTDHTLTSYSTYIRSYLDYLHSVLHKLPEEVSWDELRDFIRWLQKNRSLSDRTINAFYVTRHLRAHEEFLGWEHRFTCHSFRHAFGTHLYENGADLLTIKNLMGHKSLKSTLIYIHLASFQDRHVSSPFDWTGGDSVE